MNTVRTSIVRIGNSQGIRIPKALLEQCQLQGELELEPHGDHLIVRAVVTPRAGWDAVFQDMAAQGDDSLGDASASSTSAWDEQEWEWS
jgi:antitoxin MazE